jgi:hypothetical protein
VVIRESPIIAHEEVLGVVIRESPIIAHEEVLGVTAKRAVIGNPLTRRQRDLLTKEALGNNH